MLKGLRDVATSDTLYGTLSTKAGRRDNAILLKERVCEHSIGGGPGQANTSW